jgi:hypothetical protein
VIPLPDDIIGCLPELSKVGNKVVMTNTRTWKKLAPASISESFEGRVPSDPLCFQLLDPLLLQPRHGKLRQAIGKLKDLFKGHLRAERVDLEYTAFLKSPSYAPQACHTDFRDEEFVKSSQGRVFLAFVPLTRAGMFLQIWPGQNQPSPGRILFIPYRKALFVPADTVHGGGFLSCPLMHNLRLHFYIYLNGLAPPKINANSILDETQYPQSDALLADGGGLLASLFEGGETCDTKKRARDDATEEVKPTEKVK